MTSPKPYKVAKAFFICSLCCL